MLENEVLVLVWFFNLLVNLLLDGRLAVGDPVSTITLAFPQTWCLVGLSCDR